MVHKNKLLLFAAIFFSFAFTNCTKKDAQNPNVKAKQSIPQRIVSLSPASTEILFAVGAENQIVAVSDFSDYPPQAQNLPKVGGFDGKTLSLEKILSFNPDFVYLTNVMHNHLIPHFESLNIDYYLSDANSFEQVKNEILQIAKITGHTSTGENLVKEIDSGATQREIAKNYRMSLCKITRGSKELSKSDSAFRKMLELLKNGLLKSIYFCLIKSQLKLLFK